MAANKDMHFTRDRVVQDFREWGMPEVAELAARELPESFDGDELFVWSARNNISMDLMINRMGGSP